MTSHEWSPEKQLARLEHDFEDVIDRFMRHDWGIEKQPVNSHHPPAIESFIESGRLVIRADLPGVDPKTVEIAVDENVLTIRAVRVADANEQGRSFGHREIRYGTFARAISIPKGVRKEEIRATHRDGVLELTIPLGADAVRRVPVQMVNRRGEVEKRQ
jgi:HSP20 family protein